MIVEAARRFGVAGRRRAEAGVSRGRLDSCRLDVWSAGCAEIDAACEVPWTLLSAGEDFERFARMLEVACDHGASGFVAGRTVWQEAVSGGSLDPDWMETAAARLRQLAVITQDRARPWNAGRSSPGPDIGGARDQVVFPRLDDDERRRLLGRTRRPVRVVIDTDRQRDRRSVRAHLGAAVARANDGGGRDRRTLFLRPSPARPREGIRGDGRTCWRTIGGNGRRSPGLGRPTAAPGSSSGGHRVRDACRRDGKELPRDQTGLRHSRCLSPSA